ncbi:MAG: acylglycerol kinase family protein [Rhodospirillaceae bacterium]
MLARTTERAGDAREFARTIDGVDVIVSAGGDSTVNEVVDDLCARPYDAAMPSVAFLPRGTANWWPRNWICPGAPTCWPG